MENGGLSRSTLTSVGPVPGRNTLKLLPFGKSRRQKVLVGEGSGVVSCLEFRRGGFDTVFSKQISPNPIVSLVLDGDKFYISEGKSIRGMTKRGKEFQQISTNLSSTIRQLVVADGKTWVAGDVVYASYVDGKEKEYVKCEDSITGMVVKNDITFIGSVDNRIHAVVAGSISASFVVGGAITALEPYGDDGLIYGTEGGSVGYVRYDQCNLREVGRVDDTDGEAVSVLTCFDLTKDDKLDIIVGRDGGSVDVYAVEAGELRLMFHRNVEESIQSIQAGTVTTPGYDEIIMCTFSGQIISLTTEVLSNPEEGDKKGRDRATCDAEMKVKSMIAELESLNNKVSSYKAKLAKKSNSVTEGISFHQLQVNSNFVYSHSNSWYVLSIELPISIHSVLLQSNTSMSLVDFKNSTTQEGVVLSSINLNGPLQAVFRCTEPTKRLQIRIRSVEGAYGDLKATVVANVMPKIAKQISVPVKPLSIHHRVMTPIDVTVPLSTLDLQGTFSLNQVLEWVSYCLPNVPTSATPAEEDGFSTLYFENSFVQSVLVAKFQQGHVVFQSDSISTIAILREVISNLANKRNVNVNIQFTICPKTVSGFLSKLDKSLQHHSQNSQRRNIVDALREITNDSKDVSFLSIEHQTLLKSTSDGLNFESQDALFGVVYDLYVDVQKFKGIDARTAAKHHSLMQVLQNYDFDALLHFFDS